MCAYAALPKARDVKRSRDSKKLKLFVFVDVLALGGVF